MFSLALACYRGSKAPYRTGKPPHAQQERLDSLVLDIVQRGVRKEVKMVNND